MIINPGNFDYYENGNTSFNGIDSYIMLPNDSSDVLMRNNYLKCNFETAGISAIDFMLLPDSLLIDSGYTLNKELNSIIIITRCFLERFPI
jgi:hypothetical protein